MNTDRNRASWRRYYRRNRLELCRKKRERHRLTYVPKRVKLSEAERKEKARERRRARYLANRELVKARSLNYYRAHRAQILEQKKLRKNPKHAAYCRAWRARRKASAPKLVMLPAPAEMPKGWTDKDWWKLTPQERPRNWAYEPKAA